MARMKRRVSVELTWLLTGQVIALAFGYTGRLAAAREKTLLTLVHLFHLDVHGVCSSMAASLVGVLVQGNSNWQTSPR